MTAERWKTGEALLLAQIPGVLERTGVNIRPIQGGRSLRETIATEAFDKLKLISNPEAELVWGVVPKSAILPEDLAPLFKRKTPQGPSIPRYKKWFWTAFVKPIPDGHKRYILLHSFSDIPEAEPLPPGASSVEPTDIVQADSDTPINYAAVQKLISEWAARSGAILDQYYLAPSREAAKRTAAPTHFPKLANLPEEDLKRIMVPLDIVLKLIR